MNIDEIIKNSKASIEKSDLAILLPILAKINPKNILEIGGWKGYSSDIWIKAFNPEIFMTIEKDSFGKLDPVTTIKKGYTYAYGCDSHSGITWTDTLSVFNNSQIDFLFIDGDHSAEGVLKDYTLYSGLVRKGGMIAFHDCCYHQDKTEEVDLIWNGLKKKNNYIEIKTSENSTGIGVIFK